VTQPHDTMRLYLYQPAASLSLAHPGGVRTAPPGDGVSSDGFCSLMLLGAASVTISAAMQHVVAALTFDSRCGN
jgi:hypothetical protein